MTKEELIALARTYEEAILVKDITRSEIVILLALLDARLKIRIGEMGITKPVIAVPTEHSITTPPIPTRKPGVIYDPVFDPPPAMAVEIVPERPTTEGTVLAKRNHACVCIGCNTVAYMVNKDIIDGCNVADFIASFSPTPGNPVLTKHIEIQNLDGRISIDCPACGAHKSLYLTGKS